MKWLCPFVKSTNCNCDDRCRFYNEEPQERSGDPRGPGSCALAEGSRALVRLADKLGAK